MRNAPTKESPLRVLVVDDSAFMRRIISDILSRDPRLEVVGKARDGEDALVQARTLKPQVITLDVEMPRKNGLQVLEEIMRTQPTAVVMVSSLTAQGADVTMRSLAAGAVDFVLKPSGTISLDMEKVAQELCQKVVLAGQVDLSHLAPQGVPKPLSDRVRPVEAPGTRGRFLRLSPGNKPRILVVAASTGGPRALQEILPALPARLSVPVVVVQHMPEGFTASFAARMNDLSALAVVEGDDGLPLRPGLAVVARGGRHLVIEEGGKYGVCRLSDAPPENSVRPAADPLFRSAAKVFGGAVVGAILTGMGKDGTEGARVLRAQGATIISEAPETCVVYGMPRVVFEAGLVDRQVPLYEMARALVNLVEE